MTNNLENLENFIESLDYILNDLQECENKLDEMPDYSWKKRSLTFTSETKDEIIELIAELEVELEAEKK